MSLKEYWQMTKEVFGNRNILSISLTTMMYSLVQMAWMPFWPMYLKNNLGANTVAIGLISGITTAQNMLFSLPGGVLADRYGRKKIIVAGTFLRTFSPMIYLLAPSWEWIIPAAIFNGMASLYMPAFTAIIADSMPPKRRGTGYGVYNTITSLPNIVSPLIGGICMERFGYEEGLRIFLILQVVVSFSIAMIRWKFTRETIDLKSRKTGSRFSIKEVTGQPKQIQIMLIVAIIGSFSGRLVMDFMNLYALDILKITPTQLGLVSTIVGAISALLSLPSGLLSDKYGRKNNIMASRVTNPLTQWILAYATNFEVYASARFLNGFALALGGGGQYAGGPSWNALIADIVPPEKRATVIGTQNTLAALVGAPSAVLGGWLWQTFSPQTPFMVSGVIGLIAAGLFWWGVDEPSKEEKLETIEKNEREKEERDKTKGESNHQT